MKKKLPTVLTVLCLFPYPVTKTAAIGRGKREITNELDSIKMCFPFCIRYFCIIYPTVRANFPPHT